MIQTEHFVKGLQFLMTEAFGLSDSPNGYFLDSGQDGLLGCVNQLSAETASAVQSPETLTLASHCGHVLFLLHLFTAFEQGNPPAKIDWPGSWSIFKVDEAEWNTLRADLKIAFDTVIAGLNQSPYDWPEQRVSSAMMLLAHVSFHVGQIRQLLTFIAPQPGK